MKRMLTIVALVLGGLAFLASPALAGEGKGKGKKKGHDKKVSGKKKPGKKVGQKKGNFGQKVRRAAHHKNRHKKGECKRKHPGARRFLRHRRHCGKPGLHKRGHRPKNFGQRVSRHAKNKPKKCKCGKKKGENRGKKNKKK